MSVLGEDDSASEFYDADDTALERPSTYPPHHYFNTAISKLVKNLMVRDKRQIFVSMRSGLVTPNSFFPKFGLSAGEFATWQILNERPRQPSNKYAENKLRNGSIYKEG